jgi:hypothetical protein
VSEYLSDERLAEFALYAARRELTEGEPVGRGPAEPSRENLALIGGGSSPSESSPLSEFFQRAADQLEDANNELLRLLDLLTEVPRV